MSSNTTFTVLTVCSGNLVRSPLAAGLLAARAPEPGIEYVSAGTVAVAGDPMPAEALALASRYGADLPQHRSQVLTEQLLADANLVLTATREHRGDVARLTPIASRHTFTMREFARLVESLDSATLDALPAAYPERGLELVRAVAARRGVVLPLAEASDDDLDDPFLRPVAVYDRVGAELDATIAVIARVLVSPEPEREE